MHITTDSPEDWREAAEVTSTQIFGCIRKSPRITVNNFLDFHNKFIDDFFQHPSGSIVIARWATMGAMAIEMAAKEKMPISQKTLITTLCKKQHDYGPNNILRFGQQGVMIRVWDKISRLDNLVKQDYDPVVENESEFDTLLDIAGYSTIGIMLARGWFRLPLTR
jgi:hypothetical protein